MKKFGTTVNNLQLYYEYWLSEVFKQEPVDQWVELKSSAEVVMKVNPIWFTGHRVYELPVMLTSTFGVPLWANATAYLCFYVLNNHEETLFEFESLPCTTRCIKETVCS